MRPIETLVSLANLLTFLTMIVLRPHALRWTGYVAAHGAADRHRTGAGGGSALADGSGVRDHRFMLPGLVAAAHRAGSVEWNTDPTEQGSHKQRAEPNEAFLLWIGFLNRFHSHTICCGSPLWLPQRAFPTSA